VHCLQLENNYRRVKVKTKKLISESGFSLLLIIVFCFISCSTMADYNYAKINSNLAQGKYGDVRSELVAQKDIIYSVHDEVLYSLDNGILEHFENLYSDSNKSLSVSERLMEKYSALSISQTLASAVTNDMASDYAGEDFENIYSNIFMALNYLALNEADEAMVEVRRFDNKLKLLKQNYEKQVKESNKKNEQKVKHVSIKFSNSALARYLSMLMYRSLDDSGNAGVDLKLLKAAFTTQPSLFDFSIPSTIDEELSVPSDMARLNILAFSGRAPIKKENIIRFPYGPNRWYKLSLPEMEKQHSDITSITVKAVNDLTGQIYSSKLEKIESIENIAVDTFQQRYSIIFTRSLIRSISKQVVQSGFDTLQKSDAVQDSLGATLIVGTVGFLHQIATEVSERADVRSSRYFPATASVCGLTVEPGSYTVTVDFMHNKSVRYTQVKKIKAFASNLNLVEAACLR